MTIIAAAEFSVGMLDDSSDGYDDALYSRSELDSHANMYVVGRHAYIINQTGKSVDVNPFTPDYNPIKVKMVNALVQYDCPYNGTTHLLLLRDALHVPSMPNNLLPPFAL